MKLNMKRLILSLAAVVAMFAGCQKPELESPFGNDLSFVASVEAFSSQTKTAMNSDRHVLWTEDDRVAIFQGSTLADEYAIDESCAGKSHATLNPVDGEGGASASKEFSSNVAFYPYADALSLTVHETSYEVKGYSLPSVQHYAANSFGDGAFPMVAVTANIADRNLKFKNVLGAMKLQLKGTQVVKSIKVEGANGEKLSDAATITAYAGNLAPVITITSTDEASKSVTLDCGDGVQLSPASATDFIIALPPVIFTKGFTVTVTDTNSESYTITTKVANPILRSSILVMPEVIVGDSDDVFIGGISIDGDFSDWDALTDVATATCAPNAKYTALKTLKAYADAYSVYIYFEFSDDEIVDREWVPFHVHINQDNNTEGCGDALWLGQGGQDWLLEGVVLADDAFCSYDPGLFKYTGADPAIVGWAWDEVLPEAAGSGIAIGAGADNRYELVILKESCPDIEWAETFGLGIDIQQNWEAVGVLPNAEITDDNPDGIAPFLHVTHGATPSSPIVSISLNCSSYTLHEGGKWQLLADLYPSYDNVVWSSDDPSIATVDQNGLVTFVSEGSTLIRATAGGKTASCYVTVEKSAVATMDYIDEYGVNHGKGTAIGKTVWAPVNCGYHATDYQWGKLYQWGRKYGQGYDGELSDSYGNVIGSITDATVPGFSEGGVSLQGGQSAKNKNVFFICQDSPYDWLFPSDDKLWNSGTEESPVKTEYDPCPEGWRVPTSSEFAELIQNHSVWITNENGQPGYWFSGASYYSETVQRVFLPAAGILSHEGYSRGSSGEYWTSGSRNDDAHSLWFSFNYDSTYLSYAERSFGASVRCLQNTSGEPVQDDLDEDLLIPVLGVTLNSTSLRLYGDDDDQLTAKVLPVDAANKSVVWSSSDPSVATVDQSGFVTAVSVGTAEVYAQAGDFVATCYVTVDEPTVASLDYIDEYGINHGKGTAIGMAVWAPVNCGYHAIDYQWGKLYQWGRKYGQGYSGELFDSYGNVIGSVTDATVPEYLEGQVSLEDVQSANNMNVFYSPGYPFYWLYPQVGTLWNSGTEESPKKTEYDPCPEGWRVPTYSELEELSRNHSSWTTNEAGQNGRWFSDRFSYSSEVTQVFFPAAGHLDYSKLDGRGTQRGGLGLYWSSLYDSYAYNVWFSSNGVLIYSEWAAYGYSVRCVQE